MLLSPQERLIVSVFNHENADWPLSEPAGFAERFIEVSDTQSTHALIYHQLKDTPAWSNWPIEVRDSLRVESKRLAAVDLLRGRELTTVLEELRKINIRPLIFKGAALAHTHYPSPSLRTRNDTDLLITDAEQEIVSKLLERLGYRTLNAVSGKLISYECCYRRTDKFSVSHVLDVHVRINNSQFFAQALTYKELREEAIAVPALGTNALTLSLVHSLMLACLHRAAHMRDVAYYNEDKPYYESNLLIWLYDIHLLAASMKTADWDRFGALATEKKVRAICLDALQTTVQCFHSNIPSKIITLLAAPGKREASSAYLTASPLQLLCAEIRVIPGLYLKLLFIWENFFPSADYMRQKYAVKGNHWLPFLYLHRAVNGILKRLER